MYKKADGKGLAFSNGVLFEADNTVPDNVILSFHQVKGIMEPMQLKAIVEDFAFEHPELELTVTEENYLQLAEKYYDSAQIRGSIIYMATFADGDVAIKCKGYY